MGGYTFDDVSDRSDEVLIEGDVVESTIEEIGTTVTTFS